jgi:ferritin-like metal-binding protein YciE
MRFSSANLDSLRQLYIGQLQTLLSAERQIREALPHMIEEATEPKLRQAFQVHLQETRQQVERLEQILEDCTGEAVAIPCEVLTALILEAQWMIKDAADDSVRDAALIASAQRIEHYEIAAYGSVRHFARILGEILHAQLLDQTVKEEGRSDHMLTDINMGASMYVQRAA